MQSKTAVVVEAPSLLLRVGSPRDGKAELGGGRLTTQPGMFCAQPEVTINATPGDVVIEGTPIDLTRPLKIDKPIAAVTYELEEIEPGVIEKMVKAAVK
jgi:hypothetical protein